MTIARTAALASLLLAPTIVTAQATAPAESPVATVIPKVDTLHGDVRVDNYYWLREKANSAVTAYLQAENAYTETQTAHTAGLRQRLYREMLGRIKENDFSVPDR